MGTVIKLKRSEVAGSAPSSSDLTAGEVAMNTADQKLYTKTTSGSIVVVADVSSAAGSSSVLSYTRIYPANRYLSFTDSSGTLHSVELYAGSSMSSYVQGGYIKFTTSDSITTETLVPCMPVGTISSLDTSQLYMPFVDSNGTTYETLVLTT